MAPRETENNAYAKFWGDKQSALWYVMVFSGVVNYIILQVFSFSIFLCKFQVISQAEQEQAELEVKTTKHEIFKVNSLFLHIQLNNTELKPITELRNEHRD